MAEKGSVQTQRASRPVSSRRSARVAEKLQQKIRDKEYYEAHQTYRVLYQRYKAQGKESEALDLLYDGAILFFQHGQVRLRSHEPTHERPYKYQNCFLSHNTH